MSAIPLKADIDRKRRGVCFVPKADIPRCGRDWRYSITSSAVARRVCGIVTPSALAVFEFTISSKRVGRSAGRSAGLVPLRSGT